MGERSEMGGDIASSDYDFVLLTTMSCIMAAYVIFAPMLADNSVSSSAC